MQSTTTRRVNRRALIIHPIAALTLATLMALLALPPHPWTPPADAVTVTPPPGWMVAVAVLGTAIIGALIAGMARGAHR